MAPESTHAGRVTANGLMLTLEHPVLGPLLQPAGPLQLSETPYGVARAAPVLGQDTDAVLIATGPDPAGVAALRQHRVVL